MPSREPPCAEHTCNDAGSNRGHGPGHRFMQERRRQRETDEGLEELQLTNSGDSALRQSAIPENKTYQHAEY